MILNEHDNFQAQAGQTPKVNERAVRAAAGIFLMAGMIAFMNAWLIGNFFPTKIVVIGFLIDFLIRLILHPQYAPSIIIGQFLVRKQIPEFVDLKPKKFAWSLGLILSTIMFYTIVLNNIVGPINLLSCGLCLFLLWSESSFGICLGCRIYGLIYKQPLENCPGGVCQFTPDRRSKTSLMPALIVCAFAVFIVGAGSYLKDTRFKIVAADGVKIDGVVDAERCKVPEFAKRLGHEDMWKKHNNCM